MTPDDPQGASRISPNAARSLFRTALRDVLVFLAVLAVAGVVVGAVVDGLAGVWGALMGVGVAVIFSGTTVWSMWRTADSSPQALIAVVAGSWLAKMIVLFVLLLVLQSMDFYNKPVFGVVLIVGVLGSVVLDTLAVRRARIPYVDPR
ncbi:hypothetical protein [Luteimicrobium subarcticum]|uniref:ATP synthase protein I n=1 Tax=Luteimicrobium subarcticum TaxID=620910 RepID=A0A2M8W1K5_9MICO|nr:hypothetical protein [Luteimicrobium subarcticum]PJI84789.1 hypothetical protein CLV34_3247 [Luteimicrobium subarcticum]